MIIDIIIIGIIVLAAVIGLAIGFYKSVLGFFAWGISFVAAFFLAAVIANALVGVDAIGGWLFGETIFGALRENISYEAISSGGIIYSLLYPFTSYIEASTQVANGALSSHDASVALLVFGLFTTIITFALFGLVRLIMIPFVRIFKRTKDGKKRKLRAASRVGGFFFGAIKGGIWALTIFIFVSFTVPFIPFAHEQIDDGFIASPVFNLTATMQARLLGGNVRNTLDTILPIAQQTLGTAPTDSTQVSPETSPENGGGYGDSDTGYSNGGYADAGDSDEGYDNGGYAAEGYNVALNNSTANAFMFFNKLGTPVVYIAA